MSSLLVAMTLNLLVMAIALPYFMGQVNLAARYAQAGMGMHTAGWMLLLIACTVPPYSLLDRSLSTLSMAAIAAGIAWNAAAFNLWYGRPARVQASIAVAALMTIGYGIGYGHYAFRVGWANGLLALQIAMVVVALCRRPQVAVGRWRWLLVMSLLAQMIVTAWRGVLGAVFPDEFPHFFAPHLVNLVFALVCNVTMVMSMAAILLAHRDEAARELQRLATVDGLTGALNRRAWLEQVGIDLAMSVRYRQPTGLLMMDLDYFKRINDTRGHAFGDMALQKFVRALAAVSRTGDLYCRYGGEEFCVLLHSADIDAVKAYDARLRSWLAQHSVSKLGFELSYSAGIAMRLSDTDTIEAMLQRADGALYLAKAQGRSQTLDSDLRAAG
ncbi:MAG: GGDEF domain-containing protein [Duganella sp.]